MSIYFNFCCLSFFKYSKESTIQRRADLISISSAIIALIDSSREIESKSQVLRKIEKLANFKNIDSNRDDVSLSLSIDEKSEKMARYIATTYDNLGFILKNDIEIEIYNWMA